jgi:hypothetical protein
MRFLSALFAAILLSTTIAHAQSKAPSSAPVASPAELADTTAATREVLQALFFDIGVFDRVASAQMPGIRDSVRNSPQYLNADAQRRLALDQFLEAMPSIIRAEVANETDAMASNIAQHVAQTMRPDEILAFATFFRSAELRPFVNRIIGEGIASDFGEVTTEPTPEEATRIAAFMETADGRAIAAHSTAFWPVVGAELQAAAPRILQRLRVRIYGDMCAALGDECPPELRPNGSPT